MRLYVQDSLAQTYFEIPDDPPHQFDKSLQTPSNELGRAIGRLYRAVVEPFCLGILYEDISGTIWLDHVGMPGRLQYVNVNLQMLRGTCERWTVTLNGDRDFRRFARWLDSTDAGVLKYRTQYPYSFWDCEIGDMLDPFGPLDTEKCNTTPNTGQPQGPPTADQPAADG